MARILYAVGAILLAVSIGAGLVVALDPFGADTTVLDSGGPPPDVEATKAAADSPPISDRIPQLTAEDEQRIRDIAQSDPDLLAALKGIPIVINGMGIWTNGPEKLGAGFDIAIDPPATLEYDWPYIVEDGDSPGNIFDRFAYRVEDVTAVNVLVDLAAGRVVSINPYRHGAITYLEPIPTPLDQGKLTNNRAERAEE